MSKRTDLEHEFEELFQTNYSRLFYYALDWLEDSETAKDLVSETMSAIWQQYPSLRDIDNMQAYLFRMTRNNCINYLKHKAVESKYMQEQLAIKEKVIDESPDAHDENLRILQATIGTMPAKTRFVFEQAHFESKSYSEIAELLDISVSAVNKHISKAFQMLRDAFDKKDKKN